MADSILDGTKDALGLDSAYTYYDQRIIMYINSIFPILQQLGVGPPAGFAIQNKNQTWESYLESDLLLNSVPTYMYLRVRLLFDPPSTGPLTAAMEEQHKEMAYRINLQVEEERWLATHP